MHAALEKNSARFAVGQNAPMAGRPTKLTEAVADDLVVLLAAGVPVEDASRSVGVSRRTLDRWLRQDELRGRIEQARVAGPQSSAAALEARMVVLLLRAAQFDWRASAWWLERTAPQRWGPERSTSVGQGRDRHARSAALPAAARRGHGSGENAHMISFLLVFRGLARAVVAVWRDPDTKALPIVAGFLLLTGTIVYWRFEDWSFIQALYFSVVTLTTVGYGDLTPTSDGTRIFTIFYILTGLGVLVAFLSSLAQQYIRLTTEHGHSHTHERLTRRRHHDQPPDEGEST